LPVIVVSGLFHLFRFRIFMCLFRNKGDIKLVLLRHQPREVSGHVYLYQRYSFSPPFLLVSNICLNCSNSVVFMFFMFELFEQCGIYVFYVWIVRTVWYLCFLCFYLTITTTKCLIQTNQSQTRNPFRSVMVFNVASSFIY
jgi:hypothetical protein